MARLVDLIHGKSTLSSSSIKNADIIAIVEKNNCYCIQLFVYRFGQSYGNIAYFPFQTDESNKAEILTQFINQFYQTNPVPDEIIINHPIIDLELVTKAIKQLSGNNKLSIIHPIRGNKVKLLENAELNGQLALDQHLKQFAKNQMIFQQIQQLFNLPLLPDRIEVYDNSHIMGTFAVGSMIVATKSGFDKKEYRIFNIPVAKGDAKGGDDYEMLRTVLTRRFTRLKKEHPKSIYSNDLENGDNKQGVSELGVHEVREYANTPQVFAKTNSSKQKSIVSLMIIDGGKGHLSVVQKIMAEFGLAIPFVCMSKGPDRNAGCEQFHMLGKEAFTINKNLPVMKYLQILRDEAHNFAIKNHRLRRSKAIKVSSLDDINSNQ